jgi:hypothetical protein
MGVSVDTIARALKGKLASLFVRVEPRYRYDPIRKKKIRTSSIYHVAIDDPLLPEDEKSLHALLAKVDIALHRSIHLIRFLRIRIAPAKCGRKKYMKKN